MGKDFLHNVSIMPYQNNLFILKDLYKFLSEHFPSIQQEKRIIDHYL